MTPQVFWGYTSTCVNCERTLERRHYGMWVHQDTGQFLCEPWQSATPTKTIKEVWTDASI